MVETKGHLWSGRDGVIAIELAVGVFLIAAIAYFLRANVVELPKDFSLVWHGSNNFWHGRIIYVAHPSTSTYNHPPSSAFLIGPLILFPLRTAAAMLGVVNLLLVLWLTMGLTWVTRRDVGSDVVLRSRRLWSELVASLALVICARGGRGNTDIITISLLTLGIVVLSRGLRSDRWPVALAGGMLVGLSCCMKPTVSPAVVGLVAAGAVGPMVVAAGVMVGVNLVILAVVPPSRDFVRHVVPYLIHGQPIRAIDNASVASFLSGNGRRTPVGSVLVLVILGAIVWVLDQPRRLWGRHHLRDLLAMATLPMLAVFVVSSSAFSYYWVYAAPALAVCLIRRWERVLGALALASLVVPAWFFTKIQFAPVRIVLQAHLFWAFVAIFVAIASGLRPTKPLSRLAG